MKEIQAMSREELLTLNPSEAMPLLSAGEVIHIAQTLGAFWQYDYKVAERGKVGRHAELKSLRHSDGFFVSKILLQEPNIRKLFAYQICHKFSGLNIIRPDRITGIPDGATELGREVAEILEVPYAEMGKIDGKIVWTEVVGEGEELLLVEDFCTRGTGFREAVLEIRTKQPDVTFLPYELVILNRGGLKEVIVEGIGTFKIVAVVENRVEDWDPADCPLCQRGSIAIKPKVSEENWQMLTTSQL